MLEPSWSQKLIAEQGTLGGQKLHENEARKAIF